MMARRWTPIILYVLGFGFFAVQLFSAWHQLPASIVIILSSDGHPSAVGNSHSFLIFLALASVFAPVPFSGTFWRLRSLDPDSFSFPHKDYWRRPENWRRGCDTLFFSSFWLALAQLMYWVGLFSFVVRTNQQQPPSMDSGPLHILWGCCMAVVLAWATYAIWFVYRAPSNADA